jgi:hypothetical protein
LKRSGERFKPKLIQPAIDAAVRYGFLPKPFAVTELFAPNAGWVSPAAKN